MRAASNATTSQCPTSTPGQLSKRQDSFPQQCPQHSLLGNSSSLNELRTRFGCQHRSSGDGAPTRVAHSSSPSTSGQEPLPSLTEVIDSGACALSLTLNNTLLESLLDDFAQGGRGAEPSLSWISSLYASVKGKNPVGPLADGCDVPGKQDPQSKHDPQGTRDPRGTQDPQGTQDPRGTQDPTCTQDPRGTHDPQGTQDPTGTQDPRGTHNPRGTQDPAGAQDPQHTQELPSTQELQRTQSSVVDTRQHDSLLLEALTRAASRRPPSRDYFRRGSRLLNSRRSSANSATEAWRVLKGDHTDSSLCGNVTLSVSASGVQSQGATLNSGGISSVRGN